VPGLVRVLQADFSRRNQGANQQNGHRRALEDALQHGFSLLRSADFAVMWITCELGRPDPRRTHMGRTQETRLLGSGSFAHLEFSVTYLESKRSSHRAHVVTLLSVGGFLAQL
jgi:hypothetical protein